MELVQSSLMSGHGLPRALRLCRVSLWQTMGSLLLLLLLLASCEAFSSQRQMFGYVQTSHCVNGLLLN